MVCSAMLRHVGNPDMKRQHVYAVLGAVIFICILCLGAVGERGVHPDADNYLSIANGRTYDAYQPFSARQLHPQLVRAIARLTHFSLDQVFSGVAVVTLACFLAVAIRLLYRETPANVPLWSLFTPIPLLLIPWLGTFYQYWLQPELMHACLTACFFLLLPAYPLAAMAVLISLILTRESSVLLAASLIAVCVLQKRLSLAVQAVVASSIGIGISILLVSASKGNVHNLPRLLYLIGKVPYFLAYNCLGLLFLIDKQQNFPYFKPHFLLRVPEWLSFGGVQYVAYCGFDPSVPIMTVLSYAVTFGILPIIIWIAWYRCRPSLRLLPLASSVAIVYAALTYATAPLLGNSISRYLNYAWPIFLVAGPALTSTVLSLSRPSLAGLFVIHMALSWSTILFRWLRSWGELLSLLIGVVILSYGAYRIVNNRYRSAVTREEVGANEASEPCHSEPGKY